MATSITGNASNVEINNANVWITDSDKRVIAPRGEFTDATLSLTTVGAVGIANTAPTAAHTLAVGDRVYFDDDADTAGGEPTLKVHGLLEADSINFGSAGTPGAVFFADATGALTTGDGGLSFDNASNTVTSNGPVVSLQGISLFKDTVANNTTIIGTLDVTGQTVVPTLTANATSVTTLGAHGAFNVYGAASNVQVLTANATTVYDGLTVASGTALVGTLVANAASTTDLTVNGGLTVADGQGSLLKDTVANNTTIVGTLDVSSDTTLSAALTVTGDTLAGTVTANSTSTTDLTVNTTLDVSGAFNVYGSASNVAALTANATSIYDALNVYAATPVFHNNLQVNGDLLVDGNLTVLATENLVVDDPFILLGNTNTNSGAQIDVGMFFRQAAGSNVVTAFTPATGKYHIAKTTDTVTDNSIDTSNFSAIEVLVTGSFEATANVQADTMAVNSGVLIKGNSIIFA